MSKESVPSKPFQIVDLPEVTNVVASSVYNFYTNDEMINESGNSAVNGNLSDSLTLKGTADTANLNARTPRYVKLSFAVQDCPKSILGKKSTGIKTSHTEVLNALNAGSVFTEEATAGTGFDNYTFDQSGLVDDLELFWSRKFSTLGSDYDEASSLELLDAMQVDKVEPTTEFLESMLPPADSSKTGLSLSSVGTQFLKNEQNHYTVGMLNSSYAPYMLKREVSKGLGLSIESNLQRFLESIQNVRVDESKYASDDEYLFDVPMKRYRCNDPNFVAEAEVVGYLFEKERVMRGQSYKMSPIFVKGSNLREAYDSQVAYGQTYRYAARSIAKFRVPITDWDTGATYIGEFFYASRLSAPVQAKIFENRRPDPPSDISYYYDYDADNLLITWSPPVNPQRDIKYIQIFRRKDITEPFQLLAHYDFDDSIIVKTSMERPGAGLTIESTTMPTFYVDSEWNSTKSYIYAIVCIDARQLSSYYSTQTRVSYDSTIHKIKKEFISYQGAPKQYPNWYLKENFFPDIIKDSSHAKVSVYFNPEAYTLLRSSGEELPAFYSKDIDPDSKYLFQFINVDRLAEHQIEVQIEKSKLLQAKETKSTRAAGPTGNYRKRVESSKSDRQSVVNSKVK